MTNYREIVTKAIIGKCKKNSVSNYDIVCEQKPDTVLGCWVINHKFSGLLNGSKVSLSGSFDVNVWYSYDNDTKTAVATHTFNYNDLMPVNLKNSAKIDNKSEIIVECLKQPTVTDVKINSGIVNLKVEKELGASITGNTTIKIEAFDDEDDYEEIVDNEADELNINMDELNDDYLNDSVNEK